jgi:hypothetical protein
VVLIVSKLITRMALAIVPAQLRVLWSRHLCDQQLSGRFKGSLQLLQLPPSVFVAIGCCMQLWSGCPTNTHFSEMLHNHSQHWLRHHFLPSVHLNSQTEAASTRQTLPAGTLQRLLPPNKQSTHSQGQHSMPLRRSHSPWLC